MKLSFLASEDLFFFFKFVFAVTKFTVNLNFKLISKNLFAFSKHIGWVKLLSNGEEKS